VAPHDALDDRPQAHEIAPETGRLEKEGLNDVVFGLDGGHALCRQVMHQ
jgi:hypothetical protein